MLMKILVVLVCGRIALMGRLRQELKIGSCRFGRLGILLL
jgi:hypothetical protein